jgi:glycosyltransferase involved in cell wall biosynthesis
MTDPQFSIVTISYNQAEFLPRTIESVLSQKGVGVQYIVCDPGSTDGSRQIIDSYGDAIAERVFERDDGPADGLNGGFARATGDIYAYINSDDTFLPGTLARVVAHFRRHPEIDVLTGHGLVVDSDDVLIRKVWSTPYRRRMAAHGVAEQFQSATFIRAAAFRRAGGFNPRNRSCWDAELLMDLFLSGARIAVFDEFLGTFRLHPASITASGAARADAARFNNERFSRLMGREPRGWDPLFGGLLKLWKALRYPRTGLERLRRGPVCASGNAWRRQPASGSLGAVPLRTVQPLASLSDR